MRTSPMPKKLRLRLQRQKRRRALFLLSNPLNLPLMFLRIPVDPKTLQWLEQEKHLRRLVMQQFKERPRIY